MLLYALIAGGTIIATSIIGVVIMVVKTKNTIEKHIKYLVTFAGGIFASVAYELLGKITTEEGFAIVGIMGALTGIAFMWLISKLAPEAHHHHASDKNTCARAHIYPNPKRLLFGDGVHNMADGLLLISAFAVSVNIGILTALAIFLHEMIQNVSAFFVLKDSGYGNKKTLFSIFLISFAIFIGIFIGFVATSYTTLYAFVTSVALGCFAYIIIRDMLPHTIRSIRCGDKLGVHILAGLAGILIMLLISATTPH